MKIWKAKLRQKFEKLKACLCYHTIHIVEISNSKK